MKRSKKLYILLAVLLVAVVATVIATKVQEKQEEIQNTDQVILQISQDDVTALSWENETVSLSFSKDSGGAWVYDDDAEFPVSEDAVDNLLSLFESFGASFVIENVSDYAQYGLDDPVCTINITAGDSYEITLGDFSSLDSQRYVSVGDGNVYLVSTDPLDLFAAELSDMIDNDETPSFESVSSITFSGSESYTVEYDADGGSVCADDVYYAQLDGQSLPLDTSLVESYTSVISALNPTDYVTYKVTDEELSSYGLDSPELTVAVAYTNEDDDGESVSGTFTLSVGRNPEDVQAAEAAGEDEETETAAYIRIGDSRIVYQISSEQYKNLMAAGYNDLRHREIFTADFDSVYQIDVSLDGESYTFTAGESDDDEDAWSYNGSEIDITDLSSALTALAASGADSFVTETPAEKEEISLTVYLNDNRHPQLTVALYRYDGNQCLALVDGESVALIERSLAVDLIEAVNAIVLSN